MTINLAQILSDLDMLTTKAVFKQKFEQTFAALGYDTYFYISRDYRKIQGEESDLIYLTNVHSLWVKQYIDRSYGHVDPVLKDCLSSRLPICWTHNYRSAELEPEQAQMMADARAHGLERGLTIPVHGPAGELGIFSLTSRLRDAEFLQLAAATTFEAHILAYHFHRALQAWLGTTERFDPPGELLGEQDNS